VAATLALLAGLVPLLSAITAPTAAEAAGTLALPDLISVIPFNKMQITHPSSTTKEFDYEHIQFNNGTGPLDILPTYDPQTVTATGVQRIYSYDANGNASIAQQVPVKDKFIWHAVHDHFHFPLASFGLYGVNPDGSVGSPVAMSPKNGFCIGDSVRVDPNVEHSPPNIIYNGSTCNDPTAIRGIDQGWGDLYDRQDPGQSIDITGVPDGVYWFHAVTDPNNNIVESDKSNNTTDIKLRISGDTITQLSPLMSQGSFNIDQSAIVDGTGSTQTPPITTSFPNELLVATVSAQGNNAAQTETVTGGGLTWTLAKRTNTQTGTAEVWTAPAPNPLTNAVIQATASTSGFSQSMTVLAIQGASGVGAVAGADGGTGASSVGLTTTQPGSWVIGVGNDPVHYAPHMPAAGQVIVQQNLNEASSNGTWTQATSSPTPFAGTQVTLSDTSPLADRWNMTAVEILGGNSNDHTPPVISQGGTSAIGPDRATVNWKTDEPSTSRVDYGPTNAFGSSTPLDPTLVTDHSQTIIGLTPNTTYFCNLRSADLAGNEATSASVSFTTAPPRTTPPVFSNIRITDLEPDQAIFAWDTDETATTQVEYGTTASYGNLSTEDTNQVTSHFELVTGLTPSTSYHYRVRGTDFYGNAGASNDITFTTPAIAPPISVDSTVSIDGGPQATTASFNTVHTNELLVAYVSSDGPSGVGQSANVAGGGLTWSLVARANSQSGDAEIWSAVAPNPVNMTVSSNLSLGNFKQSLTVVAYGGAGGIGANAFSSGNGSAPTTNIKMTHAGSLVYAVGNDWANAAARTVGANQTMVHQDVESASGDTFWTQRLTAPAGPVESIITMNDTAPTNAVWNFVAVEIARPTSVPATAPTISNVTTSNITQSAATITWQTDQPSSTQIKYGPTSAYGSTTALDTTAVQTHSQTITGLSPGITYHYSVQSGNSQGTTGSADATFTTAANTPPQNQTISFAGLASRALNQSPFTVSATATSGLAVTFTTTTPAVCTSGGTNGTTITLVATGTCSVVANQAGNAAFNPAPAVTQSFTVTAATTGTITVDKTVFKDGNGTQTTPAFTTTNAGDLVVAFVASDGPLGSTQTSTVTGAGLTWTLVRRTNTQAGTAEIWQARATGILTNATVTATPAKTGFDQSLTVVAFAGATGVGASNGANNTTGAPAVGLTTTGANSLVYAVGNDWDGATARTPIPGQALVHQFVDTTVGDTFWTQGATAAIPTAGTGVFVGDTAPTNHRFNITAIEILD
jgi:hypothetical protein